MDGDTIFAIGVMNRQLSRAEESRDSWQAEARRLAALLEDARADAGRKDGVIAGLSAEAGRLRRDLAVERTLLAGTRKRAEAHMAADVRALRYLAMRMAGVEAVCRAFMDGHPDSPLLRPFAGKEGQQTSRMLGIFADAFDAKGRELGIADPRPWRTVKGVSGRGSSAL